MKSYLAFGLLCAAAGSLHCGATSSPANGATPLPQASSSSMPACPEQAETRARAAELRKDGRLLKASLALQASLRQCPDDAHAAILLAQTLTDLGRYDDARAQLDSPAAQASNPSRLEALRVLDAESAAAATHRRDSAGAMIAYRAAVLSEAGSDRARSRDGFLQAWQSWPERTDFLVDAALAAHRAGDDVRARAWFDRASLELEAKYGAASVVAERFPRYGGRYLHPTVSADGRYVVTTSGDEVVVHDALTWTVRSHFIDYSYPHPVVARLSPDDSLLAIGNANGSLQVVDAFTGKLRAGAKGHSGSILDLTFRPDGGAVATSGDDGTVRIWELPSAHQLLELRGHTGKTRRVAFSPDGSLLVSTSEDHSARIWNAADGRHLRTLEGHGSEVRGLSIRHDGKWIATSSDDKTVRIWEADTGRELKVLRGHAQGVWRVAFNPDGTKLASFGSDDSVREWNTTTGELLRAIQATRPGEKTSRGNARPELEEQSQRLASLAGMAPLAATAGGGSGQAKAIVVVDVMYRADGRLLAFDLDHNSEDLAARLWDIDEDRSLHSFGPRKDSVGGIDLSPEGRRLAVGFLNGTLRIWDFGRPMAPVLIRVSSNQVRAVAWIADRDRVAVADSEGQVFVVEPAGTHPPRLLGKHRAAVRALAATRDGATLASVSEHGEVMVWNANDLTFIRTYTDRRLASAVTAAFHEDGKRMAVGALFNRGPTVTDTSAAAVVATVGDYPSSRLIGFTGDGSVAQLANDGTFLLVDAANGAAKKVEQGSESAVHLCSWIRAMNAGAPCVEPRRSPRFTSAGSYRLPLDFALRPGADLAASSSSESGIALWRPSREGELVRLVGPGDTLSACAIAGNEVELSGEDARRLVACAWGDVRMPFEVCEDRYAAKGVIERAMGR